MSNERTPSPPDAKDEQPAPGGTLNIPAKQMVHAPGEDGPPISPVEPSSMPRAEDDAESMRNSPEYTDKPGSGKHRLKPD
jgi:hypothetical protein